MRYLKSYEDHNEGIKSGIAKAGLIGSLLLNDPAKAQFVNPYDVTNPVNLTTNVLSPYSPLNPNGLYQQSMKNSENPPYKINGLSDKETSDLWNAGDIDFEKSKKSHLPKMDTLKKMSPKELEVRLNLLKMTLEANAKAYEQPKAVDDTLSGILSDINQAAKSGGDSAKFNQLFTSLSSHMKSKYNYEITNQKIEDIDVSILDVRNWKNMSKKQLFILLGWLGSICLAICGIPQAIMSFQDKHSDGISWSFLILWTVGELFTLLYVFEKVDIPMLLNYGTNILILGVILYYKANPKYPMSKIICKECGHSWDEKDTNPELLKITNIVKE